MIDMHYDLLSIMYLSKVHNDFSYVNEKLNSFNSSNVKGIVANLYFTSMDEMRKELLDSSLNDINVLDMFNTSKKLLEKYKLNIPILYSIEGCDYIKDEEELSLLYKNGLDAFLIVWNNKNIYGSGNNSDEGLSEKGKIFLNKAIDLGMGIDLSHANKKTFEDMINIIKKAQNRGKNIVCYASHSNIYELYNHPRNLTIKQLEMLKSVHGKLGLVSYAKFLSDNEDKEALKEEYLKQVKLAVSVLGEDNVMLSSDDMEFDMFFNKEKKSNQVFDYKYINDSVRALLSTYFTGDTLEKILYKNAENIFYQIKENRKNYHT